MKNIKAYRGVLDKSTDSDIIEIRKTLYKLAEILIDDYLKSRRYIKEISVNKAKLNKKDDII